MTTEEIREFIVEIFDNAQGGPMRALEQMRNKAIDPNDLAAAVESYFGEVAWGPYLACGIVIGMRIQDEAIARQEVEA